MATINMSLREYPAFVNNYASLVPGHRVIDTDNSSPLPDEYLLSVDTPNMTTALVIEMIANDRIECEDNHDIGLLLGDGSDNVVFLGSARGNGTFVTLVDIYCVS